MARAAWVVVSTLCVANVLGLAIFFGWLKSTDRLSMDRVESVRALFAETVAAEVARAEAEARDAEARLAAAAEAARVGTPPITAEQRTAIVQEYEDLVRQRTERTRRETQDMIDTLMMRQARFLEERKAFEAERESFFAMREEIKAIEGSEQFQQALGVYESVKANVAASMLMELVAAGKVDQVVAYLDAMRGRTAAKIVTEFEKRSPALAADLLERLRSHGLVAQASEGQ